MSNLLFLMVLNGSVTPEENWYNSHNHKTGISDCRTLFCHGYSARYFINIFRQILNRLDNLFYCTFHLEIIHTTPSQASKSVLSASGLAWVYGLLNYFLLEPRERFAPTVDYVASRSGAIVACHLTRTRAARDPCVISAVCLRDHPPPLPLYFRDSGCRWSAHIC